MRIIISNFLLLHSIKGEGKILMKQNNLTIRTSGFALYLFLFLMAGFALAFCFILIDILQKGFSTGGFLSIGLLVWMEVYLYQYVARQKIELRNDHLIVSLVIGRDFIPNINKSQISLDDIKSATLASIKYFEDHEKEFPDYGLRNVVSLYRNMKLTVHNTVFSVSMGGVTSSTPLMHLATKDKLHNGITISTKPFSKTGFRKLVAKLREQNIPVFIEPSLGI